MKITSNEKDWNSETLILDFLQDMQHAMLFYKLNPSEIGGEDQYNLNMEALLIDNVAELLERLGYNPKEVYES